MYAWLWRRLPGSPRARVVQLCLIAGVALLVCLVWAFPAVSRLLDRNGATVGSAPYSLDRTDTAVAPAGEAS